MAFFLLAVPALNIVAIVYKDRRKCNVGENLNMANI
jgi:hypothetical protein